MNWGSQGKRQRVKGVGGGGAQVARRWRTLPSVSFNPLF